MLAWVKHHEDRWSKWRRMDLWSLEDAVALWNLLDPDGYYDQQFIESGERFRIKPLRDIALAAVQSGKLKPHAPCEDPSKAFFEPRIFIMWAWTKSVPIPLWWDDFLDEASKKALCEDLGVFEDRHETRMAQAEGKKAREAREAAIMKELQARSPESFVAKCQAEGVEDPREIARRLDEVFTGEARLSDRAMGFLLPADPGITITTGGQRDRGKRLRGKKP